MGDAKQCESCDRILIGSETRGEVCNRCLDARVERTLAEYEAQSTE